MRNATTVLVSLAVVGAMRVTTISAMIDGTAEAKMMVVDLDGRRLVIADEIFTQMLRASEQARADAEAITVEFEVDVETAIAA